MSKHISNPHLESGVCEVCGRWHPLETHELKGGSGWRNISIKYGFQLILCAKCHRWFHNEANIEQQDELRACKQAELMRRFNWKLEDWLAVFNKSWL